MNLLTFKDRPGYFNYKEVSKRMVLFVSHNYYPTLSESWEYEISNIPYNPSSNILMMKDGKSEYGLRVYSPSMQEALIRRSIERFSKHFEVLEVTDDEDQNGKIDLKVLHPLSKEEIIIQVKSSIPNFSRIFSKELWPQLKRFNRTAEYVVVTFDERTLPDCEFQYVKANNEVFYYKDSDIDSMLYEMMDEQQAKLLGRGR